MAQKGKVKILSGGGAGQLNMTKGRRNRKQREELTEHSLKGFLEGDNPGTVFSGMKGQIKLAIN